MGSRAINMPLVYLPGGGRSPPSRAVSISINMDRRVDRGATFGVSRVADVHSEYSTGNPTAARAGFLLATAVAWNKRDRDLELHLPES